MPYDIVLPTRSATAVDLGVDFLVLIDDGSEGRGGRGAAGTEGRKRLDREGNFVF